VTVDGGSPVRVTRSEFPSQRSDVVNDDSIESARAKGATVGRSWICLREQERAPAFAVWGSLISIYLLFKLIVVECRSVRVFDMQVLEWQPLAGPFKDLHVSFLVAGRATQGR